MDIGNKIKRLRVKMGMTQEQLATKLSISAQSVSKWETGTTMPDIMLLPALAVQLGVSIDELFDLTAEQKLKRIEKRIDLEEEFSADAFKEYEAFLQERIEKDASDRYSLGLLASLYHHRMESDSRKVSGYARAAISLDPTQKDYQWLLQKADGAMSWDWNVANHSSVIDFYKEVINSENGNHRMPYYELLDNLIADRRTKEAREYFEIFRSLQGVKPFLIPVYEAAIALAEFNADLADEIMESALGDFSTDSGFLFEKAQYHARKCEYKKAIEYYEASWASEENKKPRYTDALEAIAIIYTILGDREKAASTYDRMIECIKYEWGYSDEDAAVLEVKRDKEKLTKQEINSDFC